MPDHSRAGEFTVWAPLSEFHWEGDSLALTPRVSIVRNDDAPDVSVFDQELSRDDHNQLFWASHGLKFRWSDAQVLGSQEVVNCFLLALWIVVRTKAQVKMRFEVAVGGGSRNESSLHRVLSRFGFLEGRTVDQVSSEELASARSLFGAMLSLGEKQGRLWQGLVLTFAACVTPHWQVAFVCHSAAAEALLTFSKSRGLTRRLAKACACLLRQESTERDALFEEFYSLYDTRSDIIHGRLHALEASPDEKIDRLARLEEIMRELWRTILVRADLAEELERDDPSRQKFFATLAVGYSPSEMTMRRLGMD